MRYEIRGTETGGILVNRRSPVVVVRCWCETGGQIPSEGWMVYNIWPWFGGGSVVVRWNIGSLAEEEKWWFGGQISSVGRTVVVTSIKIAGGQISNDDMEG